MTQNYRGEKINETYKGWKLAKLIDDYLGYRYLAYKENATLFASSIGNLKGKIDKKEKQMNARKYR